MSRVVTLDLHAPAVQGFLDIPVDHLLAAPLFVQQFKQMGLQRPVVVSPDAGGVARADAVRARLDSAGLAIVFKNRTSPGRVEHLEVVRDVTYCDAILVDDLISTGNTLVEATRQLPERGARAVYACAIHPVFAPGALPTLSASPLKRVLVSDSIPTATPSRVQECRWWRPHRSLRRPCGASTTTSRSARCSRDRPGRPGGAG